MFLALHPIVLLVGWYFLQPWGWFVAVIWVVALFGCGVGLFLSVRICFKKMQILNQLN